MLDQRRVTAADALAAAPRRDRARVKLQVDSTNYIPDWNDRDSWAIARAAGRVLDVGAGAGRVCLRLAESGLDAVALDVSAVAVEVCPRQGVQNVFHGTIGDLPSAELFDTFIVPGNNLGLIGSPEKAQGFLDAIALRMRPGGRIVGASLDPYQTGDPDHLAYHQANIAVGRMAGQVRPRTRYRRLASDWFDLLWMSRAELAALARAGCCRRLKGSAAPPAVWGVTQIGMD